ncbi:DUF6911 family protein [Serratia plymuthica]|uniref:Uncharacterized protein n=1 Tax=Serratia plymuthica TaxID=82996 RepID=A0A2X4V482_SERPL|nr:hypothetical protein [Serratia plymuthica]QPS18935.1 hypothetical protein I6G64_15135 [Serratia plymuthica]QPS65209.1 hypothetical protein I6G52_10930 [Serratia plymuthica]RKS62319.1 hypothetical protein C8E17_1498 [Serratia plymuthica]CAI2408518.1 Uncharacterised protein [Serratia plymuthica]SQI45871.1 Uncharacterised protein [Serratia plymuthica]
MIFLSSWTLNGKGGNKKTSQWEDISILLKGLKDEAGTLTLDRVNTDNTGPEMLQVRTEKGNYLLMLGETIEDDYEVRSYWDKSLPEEKILILGDYWSARQVTKDFDLVVRIFKEFFETGNVSTDLLN